MAGFSETFGDLWTEGTIFGDDFEAVVGVLGLATVPLPPEIVLRGEEMAEEAAGD